MSETVIVLQESSVLIGKGKSGPDTETSGDQKNSDGRGTGNLIEQWDNV